MICIIGGKGRIGKRYKTIMEWKHIPYVIYDIDTPDVNLFDYNKFIICTPTDTHVKFLNELSGATILCEKPVSKNPYEIPDMKNVYTVNNYMYVARLMKQTAPFQMTYDYYQTGPDGFYWDLSQIIYMDPEAEINNKSPKWNCSINGSFVAYRTIEESYVRMISDFDYGLYKNLWTLAQGKEMSEIVLERIKKDAKGPHRLAGAV